MSEVVVVGKKLSNVTKAVSIFGKVHSLANTLNNIISFGPGPKPRWRQVCDGFKAGVGDLLEAAAPIRPANENDPQSLSEWWDRIKSAPENIANVYRNGSLEDKVRTSVSFGGLVRGKAPKPTGLIRSGIGSVVEQLF